MSGHGAIGGARVLDLEHRALAGLVRRADGLGDHAIQPGALEGVEKAAAGGGTEDAYVHALKRGPPGRARLPDQLANQRLNTYMVISMPNRKSIAFGVSQVMMAPQGLIKLRARPGPSRGATQSAPPGGPAATGES